jgi:hypothetical protein
MCRKDIEESISSVKEQEYYPALFGIWREVIRYIVIHPHEVKVKIWRSTSVEFRKASLKYRTVWKKKISYKTNKHEILPIIKL